MFPLQLYIIVKHSVHHCFQGTRPEIMTMQQRNTLRLATMRLKWKKALHILITASCTALHKDAKHFSSTRALKDENEGRALNFRIYRSKQEKNMFMHEGRRRFA